MAGSAHACYEQNREALRVTLDEALPETAHDIPAASTPKYDVLESILSALPLSVRLIAYHSCGCFKLDVACSAQPSMEVPRVGALKTLQLC